MARYTLEFTDDEKAEALLAMRAKDMSLMLYELSMKLRSEYKYAEDADTVASAEHWRDIFYRLIGDYNLEEVLE